MKRVLYISYDGLTDYIGQSQILPYLSGCARAGHAITIISFEKAQRMKALGDTVAAKCAADGLHWLPQQFHPSPSRIGRARDLWTMRRTASRLARRQGFDLLHCRSYPAASVGLWLKRKHGIPLLFDMRGFWPDSRREGGRWNQRTPVGRALYAYWKRRERALLRHSDHIVAMSVAMRDALRAMPGYCGAPASVIPCCADFDLFRPSPPDRRKAARRRLDLPESAPVLLYLGSVGTIYRLDDHLRLFDAIRDRASDVRMLFIGAHERSVIMAAASGIGIPLEEDDFRLIAAERNDVAQWISLGDVGTCFYTPTFSSLGVSPTKLAEYLACGIPVIGNRGVGDLEKIITALDGGHALPNFSPASFEAAARIFFKLRTSDPAQLRARARATLDLPKAVEAYLAIYAEPGRPVEMSLP